MKMDVLEHDILIVGGGAAGLRAAIEAAEIGKNSSTPPSIALISKVYPVRSHTVSAEGGAAAVLREYDSLDLHIQDTLRGSDYLADQDAVEFFVKAAPEEIIQLEHWGCPWSRDEDGRISARAFGGMSVKRTFYASDKTGFHLLHAIFQTMLKYHSVACYNEWFVTSLLMDGDKVRGVIAMEMATGILRMITAKAVILATGGAGRIFPFTTNGAIVTGDGMALAYRAGAPLKDMEFIQYHPTGLPGVGLLITEGARGEGGYLLNKNGERFLERYIPNKMELGPRDIISRAIITELEEGRGFGSVEDGYVHLDLRHIGKETLEERLPLVLDLARTYVEIDPVSTPIPVRPVVHYVMGGVHTDIRTRTSLEGLYACGETACVTINGANRLGSNSLTECLVFGALAGREAYAYASQQAGIKKESLLALARDEENRIDQRYRKGSKGKEKTSRLRQGMQRAMENGVGVYRDEGSMRETKDQLAEIRQRAENLHVEDKSRIFNVEIVAAMELDNMLDVAEAIVHSALERKESRGSHSRRDFPERNDTDFLWHTLARFTPRGPELDRFPVTITHWQPVERKY
jgi:fumarate reductase flavoprotein subunit